VLVTFLISEVKSFVGCRNSVCLKVRLSFINVYEICYELAVLRSLDTVLDESHFLMVGAKIVGINLPSWNTDQGVECVCESKSYKNL
jgi:hypothetical protein